MAISVLHGTPVIPGNANGEALVSHEPLSFWGGYDHRTGEIIDRRHPLSGQIAAGKILVLPFTRGSSTTTAVLLEAIKACTAPVAILTNHADSFLALAAVVALEMYGKAFPLITLAQADYELVHTGQHLRIDSDGAVTINE